MSSSNLTITRHYEPSMEAQLQALLTLLKTSSNVPADKGNISGSDGTEAGTSTAVRGDVPMDASPSQAEEGRPKYPTTYV